MTFKKAFSSLALAGLISTSAYADNKTNEEAFKDFISPVSNPVWFETAIHNTEVRPIVIFQEIHESVNTNLGKLPLNGEATLLALQVRYAFSDTLSLIATKDGYADVQFKDTLDDISGTANIGLGVKWSPYIDADDAEILTTGIRVEVPTGETDIYQDQSGSGNIFLSYAKGFGNLHFLAYEGVRVPFDSSNATTWNDLSLHLDYKIGSFYPLIEFNWHRVLDAGNDGDQTLHLQGGGGAPINAVASNFSAVDLLDFGTTGTQKQDYMNLALGFRYRFNENIDCGFAWESPIGRSDNSLFDERYTFDLVYSF